MMRPGCVATNHLLILLQLFKWHCLSSWITLLKAFEEPGPGWKERMLRKVSFRRTHWGSQVGKSWQQFSKADFLISDISLFFLQSKGGILSKTVDYINELKLHNARMVESIKDNERLQIDTELLRQQVDDLRQENALLRAQLQQHGVELATGGPSA